MATIAGLKLSQDQVIAKIIVGTGMFYVNRVIPIAN